MRGVIVTGMALALAAPWLQAQAPARETIGFVVAVGETSVTLSNVPVRSLGSPPPGEGGTFTMPAPKPGEAPPSWVAADPKTEEADAPKGDPPPAPRPRMVMMAPAGGGDSALELTEIHMEKGAVKSADYATGIAVKVTYRESGGRKILERIEKVGPVQ